MQAVWLQELQRIIRPGGVVVASVHGRFAATFLMGALAHKLGLGAWHPPLVSAALATGFLALPDHSRLLKGVAPEGYYKITCQTSAYTMRQWSREFEILEYIEAALGFQDLIAMRCKKY
jgi:hypothetical protein